MTSKDMASDGLSSLRDGACKQSPPKASIPDAVKPYRVAGWTIETDWIVSAINGLANLPHQFKASDLRPYMFPDGEPFNWASDEAVNRLMQKWRKAGLTQYSKGRWTVSEAQWLRLQNAALNAPKGGQQ